MRLSRSILKISILSLILLKNCFASENELKEEIALKEALLLTSQLSHQEKSRVYYELALAYSQDQEMDRAFIAFLNALEWSEKIEAHDLEVSSSYLQALEEYCQPEDPYQIAHELIKRYSETVEKYPEDLHLNFLIAVAHANAKNYHSFFKNFYGLYPYLWDSFLADKTQGILYLKLAQHSINEIAKISLKQKASFFLIRALQKNPLDSNLYKTLIFLAKDEKKDALLLSLLSTMVAQRVPFARRDICFYVQEAVRLKEHHLAEALIEYAQSLYQYSRAISDAQVLLNNSLVSVSIPKQAQELDLGNAKAPAIE